MNDIPKGWAFFSADFSLQASGNSPEGGVTLVRDPEQKQIWHELPSEIKVSDYAPVLYIYARGRTVEEAIEAAIKIAKETPLLKDSDCGR